MIRNIFVFLAKTFLRRSVVAQAGQATGGRLDPKLGFRMLRDRRVSMGCKLAALALGAAAAGLFQMAEMPLETVLLFVMPILGVADMAFDGFEVVAVALGAASAILPFLVPQELFNRIRQEDPHGRVFDAATASSRRR